ncbi:MAG: hypothetical protein GTN86_03875 [Xanthomonadales bacterium]|nr:hypothetical protein [Xanthomonadales bacterium]NIN59156.1 hypothetical protein [Xanthomonadales bacterium]NIN74467.1 hypothetical protein [Xanthomonadales bacterium]NIO13270.1 hypothetical protein [Xanthomonadales bacterium]NIP11549.1 hypothetical protein [Xanthomonadales bacterium]
MPRWRRIEIMREREQLRDALGGIDLGPDLLDDDIFGFEDAEDHYLQDEDESMYAPESDFGLDDAFGVPEEEWPEDD